MVASFEVEDQRLKNKSLLWHYTVCLQPRWYLFSFTQCDIPQCLPSSLFCCFKQHGQSKWWISSVSPESPVTLQQQRLLRSNCLCPQQRWWLDSLLRIVLLQHKCSSSLITSVERESIFFRHNTADYTKSWETNLQQKQSDNLCCKPLKHFSHSNKPVGCLLGPNLA